MKIKKLVILLIVLAVMGSMVACKTKDDKTPSTQTTVQTNPIDTENGRSTTGGTDDNQGTSTDPAEQKESKQEKLVKEFVSMIRSGQIDMPRAKEMLIFKSHTYVEDEMLKKQLTASRSIVSIKELADDYEVKDVNPQDSYDTVVKDSLGKEVNFSVVLDDNGQYRIYFSDLTVSDVKIYVPHKAKVLINGKVVPETFMKGTEGDYNTKDIYVLAPFSIKK